MAEQPTPLLIGLAGPKGGVGKTVLSANLAVSLARAGLKTIVADLDLGGANLQALFNLSGSGPNLAQFVHHKTELAELVKPTGIDNLSLILGATDVVGLANLIHWQKLKLISQLRKLPAQAVIIDLGAGSTLNTLDIYGACPIKLLVSTPEMTAVLNAYGFLKSLIFRLFLLELKRLKCVPGYDIVEEAAHPSAGGPATIETVIGDVAGVDEDAAVELKKIVAGLNPWLVMNMIQHPDEVRAGQALIKLARKRLGIEIGHLGEVAQDPAVRRSITAMTPLLAGSDPGPAAEAIGRIGRWLADRLAATSEKI